MFMPNIDDLQLRKDSLVDEKNQALRKKWNLEDEMNQLKETKSSYHRKGDFLTVSDLNLKEKKLQNELHHLKKQLKKVNEELNYCDSKIKNKEFEEINSSYISNRMLSQNDIKRLITKSKDISKRFDLTIKGYVLFLQDIESHSKKVAGNDIWMDELNLLKGEIENSIKDLKNFQKQTSDFEKFNDLFIVLNDADENLKDMKSNFSECIDISLRFEYIIDEYEEFLSHIDVDLKKIPESYAFDDFKVIKSKISLNILLLLKNQRYCFRFKKISLLNDILDDANDEINSIKSIFERANSTLMKFHNTILNFTKFLTKIDSTIEELEDIYFDDDLQQMKGQIENQKNDLLSHFRKYFDFDDLDELREKLEYNNKYLADMKIKLNDSQNLSKDFDSVIEDYSKFLYKIDHDLEGIDGAYLSEDFKLLIKEAENKKESLLDYQKNCFEFDSYDELNNLINTSNKDLESLKNEFNQRKIDLYDKLLFNATSTIQEKLDNCSELSSKLSNIIANAKELNELDGKNELLNNLNEIDLQLSKESKNLVKIKNNFDKRTSKNSTYRKSSNNEILHLNNLINMLNQVKFDEYERKILEQDEILEELSIQNNKLNDEVKRLLHNFEKCFNKPMFKRQLRRYNLNESELDIVKTEITNDIINKKITDADTNFKPIIKARCREFRESHAEFDDDELDSLLDIDSFSEIDEGIIIECRALVKKDLLNGNITVNNAKLKFKKYMNKKIDEKNKLEELERIKMNPTIPRIKIHLSPEENDEIYEIVQNEISSKYGIRENVENRVYYWINQKIRENQSKARGRLNIIKRDFYKLTSLNSDEQNEFITKIELLINENKIKHYEITEEKIINLSEDFMENKL